MTTRAQRIEAVCERLDAEPPSEEIRRMAEHNVTLIAQVSAQRATIAELRDALAQAHEQIAVYQTKLILGLD